MSRWKVIRSLVRPERSKPEEQENELEKTRNDLKDAFSRPEGSSTSNPLEFITFRNLHKVIDRDRLRRLLARHRWYKEADLEDIYQGFLRVIGTLIYIQWPDWDNFPQTFLQSRDPLGRPTRGDKHVPFIDVSFIEHPLSQRLFELDQYIFCPIVIKENSHDIIGNKRRRLPFLNSSPVGAGGSGKVSKVEVEKYQIIYTAGQARDEPNTKTKLMARKIIKSDGRSRSFQTERRNLDLFKKGAATCSMILQNFASFVHGSALNIIYPLADHDLHTFLDGDYHEFPDRAPFFRPCHLLGQIGQLASALHFLHSELYIDGQISECAHLDLKPENVLVFWVPGRTPSNAGENADLVGLWKIGDFGLSVIRSRESNTGPSEPSASDRLAPGDIARELTSRERSSMQAPRGPGAWQPPEMQEGRVTKASDLWSFGCILATVFAFILGGPSKVKELLLCRRRRDAYLDDYFYTSGPEPVLKPKIVAWLEEQLNAERHAEQRYWIRPTCDLIRRLLVIDKRRRGTAKALRDQISKIKRSAEDEASMWSPARVRSSSRQANEPLTTAADDSDSVESLQMDRVPVPAMRSDESIAPTRNTPSQMEVTPVHPVRPVESIASTRHTTSHLEVIHDPGLHRLREASLSWPIATSPVSYARLKTPPNTIQACLAPNGQIAAFLSKPKVFVFLLDTLVPLQQTWPDSTQQVEKIDGHLFPNSFKELTPLEGRHWTSAILAGPFIALCSAPKKGSDDGLVQIYNIRKQPATLQDNSIGPREIDVPESCGDIKLSSRGALLLMSDDHLDLHFGDSQPNRISLSPSAQAQVATFSDDGGWLCAWYTTAKYYYWCIWDMHMRSPTMHSMQRTLIPRAPNQSRDFRKILIALSNKPCFVACDQYGNGFIIRKRGDPTRSCPPELIRELCDGIIVGASLPDDKGVVFVRRPDATSNLRIETARIPEAPGQGNAQIRPWVDVERSFDGKCGLSMTVGNEDTFLLTCLLDGFLSRKKFGKIH